MNDSGWIKLHRSVCEWEWYSDIKTTRLFIHLIIKANHVDKRWQGHEVKRGQLITSYQNLSAETGLTVKQVRTSLDKLKKTGEVASKTTNKFTLLTLVKYGVYQFVDRVEGNQKGRQTANEGQAEGKQRANKGQQLKNDKNIKNERTKEKRGGELEIQIMELGEDFSKAWDRWKEFRKNKDRFTYHDEKSERSAISKLGNMAGGDPAKAIEIIENSIDNGWKGFFELKTETNGKQNSKGWAAPTIDEVIQYQRDKHGLDI